MEQAEELLQQSFPQRRPGGRQHRVDLGQPGAAHAHRGEQDTELLGRERIGVETAASGLPERVDCSVELGIVQPGHPAAAT